MSILPPIEIPDTARQPKLLTNPPSDEIVHEVVQFVEGGGSPVNYKWHTHTVPPAGARVVYLGRFRIPGVSRRPHLFAPCPCCTDHFPKYEFGYVAWFPEECVVRLMGGGCFKSLNPEGHEIAIKDLNRREAERRAVEYLLANLHTVETLERFVAENGQVAKSLDELSASLRNRLEDVLDLKLWEHIRDGQLHIQFERNVTRTRKDGSSVTATVRERAPYANIRGYQLLDPSRLPIARKIAVIEKNIGAIGDWKSIIGRLQIIESSERRKLSGTFKAALRFAADADKQIEQELQFLSRVTTDTLKTWSKREDCPLPFAFEVREHDLLVGRDANHKVRLSIEPVVSASRSRLAVNLLRDGKSGRAASLDSV